MKMIDERRRQLKEGLERASTYAATAEVLLGAVEEVRSIAGVAAQMLQNAEDYCNNLESKKPNHVVCAHCGKTLTHLNLDCAEGDHAPFAVGHFFTSNGTDIHGVPVVEMTAAWGNWVRSAKEKDFANTCGTLIHCPYCGEFPFTNKKVSLKPQVVVLLRSDIKEEGETNEDD